MTRTLIPTPSGRQRYNVFSAFPAIPHELVTVTQTAYIHAQSVVHLLAKLQEQFVDLSITLVFAHAAYPRCALRIAPK